MWSVATKNAYLLKYTSGIGFKLGLTLEKKKDKLPPY